MKFRSFFHLINKLAGLLKLIGLLDRRYRVIITSLIDLICLIFSFILTLYLLNEKDSIFLINASFTYIPIISIVALIIYKYSGHYNALTRFFSGKSAYFMPLRLIVINISMYLISLIYKLPSLPQHYWIFFTLILLILNLSTRIIIRDCLRLISSNKNKQRKRVVIYGAGEGGALLLASIKFEKNHQVLYFVDDNPLLEGCNISSLPIKKVEYLSNESQKVDFVILAIPSLTSNKKKAILEKLQTYNIPILQIPSILELARDKSSIDLIKPINIEDLLGREVASPDKKLLKETISQKVVFISGAAGSIGSELCKQVIANKPQKLIIFDHNEHSLYKLFNSLSLIIDENITLIPILGCATNLNLLVNIFEIHKVQIVFHAAAYKHVPLVEFNPLIGISNNVLTSRSICEASLRCEISSAVLISSDKAVRPANVMGASKRMSELIFQSYFEYVSRSGKYLTKYSMVRFGNVINSSGSVLPLFKKQITEGGPVTITHKDITRFFMTIPEAAQLVIQSTALAKGGDLFLLDMGKPKKIDDLARTMIRLRGFSIKDKNNPNGEIEIIYKGLRPGEKLYEELLIDSQSIPTIHPLIFRSEEPFMSYKELWPMLEKLKIALDNMDKEMTLKILLECVSEAKFNTFYSGKTIKGL